ncbi:aldose epimerase family protein [Gaoshiqia sediminis]|uniref:Aldose 1-epimerase n=1 Tax=Gaoshiqia sediminis TaxID=2986998 RepID=A0AA41Y6P3_9BACT|nr:aldose epimerase family protein [Gaoshiqia sediminis]MCW0481903.1 galactose mutarotase [Gaoshiqia sediminis]
MKRLAMVFLVAGIACQQPVKKEEALYTKTDFETTVDGKQTTLFSLENASGVKVTLTNYGGKIVSIMVPDREGKLADVNLGFKSIQEYLDLHNEYGAIIGPYANRIGNATFEIDGEVYQLPANDNGNCLHNGPVGFKNRVFDAEETMTADGPAVVLSIHSPDGEFGFPGNKDVKVTYTLTDQNELKIDYEATTDKACPFNLTNHAYFNLKGEGNGDILSHVMVIDADSTTVIDDELIPTGEIASIKGTDLDFTSPYAIGDRINSDYAPMIIGKGYDHNYILNKDQHSNELTFASSVYEPESGRFMEVFTTEPAIQFYSGNFQDGTITGKYGKKFDYRTGICLETQHYPDSPNHPNFPNTILQPGDTLRSTTIYKFSVK